MSDDLRTHAWIPEARQMLRDDLNGIVGIGHLIGSDVVDHFDQTFDIHRRLAAAFDDAFGVTIDNEIRPAYKGRECELAGLREVHGPRGWG